jgi:hypothetical protein
MRVKVERGPSCAAATAAVNLLTIYPAFRFRPAGLSLHVGLPNVIPAGI